MNENDKTSGNRPRWPGGTGILAVAIGIALLTSGCGVAGSASTASSPSSGSSTYQKELAFSQCMRSHGVPNFPDPSSKGLFVVGNGAGVNSTKGQAAQRACRSLLPNNGQPSQSQLNQSQQQALKFAQCMRKHGEPNFPDPGSNGKVRIGPGSNVNPQSPQFQAAQRACQSLMPGGAGGTS